MGKTLKKTLLIIGLVLVVFLVAAFFIGQRVTPRWGNWQEALKRNPLSTYDTAVSYFLDENANVVTNSASSRIELKINGSDQPWQTKAPFSFTLSWKIDPAIDLSDCRMEGPNIRDGYYSEEWPGVLMSNEGSLKFENVVPEDSQFAPVYNGIASFFCNKEDGCDNVIGIKCSTDAGFETKGVMIRIID